MQNKTVEKYYNIGGADICISACEDIIFSEERILSNFLTDKKNQTNASLFNFRVEEKIPKPEGKVVFFEKGLLVCKNGGKTIKYIGAMNTHADFAYICVEHVKNDNYTVYLDSGQYNRVSVNAVLNSIGMEHLAIAAGGIILHSAYICFNDEAILFTAPSGTGKSTQAELWKKLRGAKIINGDRAIIRQDGMAYGLPYAGTSGICLNETYPLKAIVYLRQSDENKILKLSGYDAFRKIWEGCWVNTWNTQDIEKATQTVCRIAEKIPIFEFECRPDENAVVTLEKTLNEI